MRTHIIPRKEYKNWQSKGFLILQYIHKALLLTVTLFFTRFSPSVKYFAGPNHPAVNKKRKNALGVKWSQPCKIRKRGRRKMSAPNVACELMMGWWGAGFGGRARRPAMHVTRCSPFVQRTVKEGCARVVSSMPTGSLQDMCVGCLVLETALGRNRVEKT